MSYWSRKFESVNIFPIFPELLPHKSVTYHIKTSWACLLCCNPQFPVSFFRFEMLLLFERLSRETIMMRLHLREPRTHWSYCEWVLCTRVAVIQGKPSTLTMPGAQRPLWPYDDFFFLTGHRGRRMGQQLPWLPWNSHTARQSKNENNSFFHSFGDLLLRKICNNGVSFRLYCFSLFIDRSCYFTQIHKI